MAEFDQAEHYDDDAFKYFFASFLLLVLIPWTISLVRQAMAAMAGVKSECSCSGCQLKAEQENAARRRATPGGIFKLVVYGCLILLLLYVLSWDSSSKVEGGGDDGQIEMDELKFGDPWELLGVPEGSEAPAIRKAYRKLSLIYHPDKNPDPEAQEHFVKITKAYETLLDPDKYAIWLRYGNMDGPGAMTIGIALPSWLVDPENSGVILGFYALCLLILLPLAVWNFVRKQKNYVGSLHIETMSLFYRYIQPTHSFRHIVDSYSLAKELRDMPFRTNDLADVKKLYAHVPRFELITASQSSAAAKAKKNSESQVKQMFQSKHSALLFAHLSRAWAHVQPPLNGDLQHLIRVTPQVLAGMMEASAAKQLVRPFLEATNLSGMFVQACWGPSSRLRDTQLMQLPHLTSKHLDLLERKYRVRTVQEYIALDDETKAVLKLTSEQTADIQRVIKTMPHDITIEDLALSVGGEADITPGAVVTMSGLLRRPNFPARDHTVADDYIPVHAPFYPEEKHELWWIVLSFNDKIISFQKIKCLRDQTSIDVKFPAPPPAKLELEVILISDSWVGFNLMTKITMVVKKDETPEPEPEEEESWSDVEAAAEFDDTDSDLDGILD